MRVTAAMLEADGWRKTCRTGQWIHPDVTETFKTLIFCSVYTFHEAVRIYKEQQEKKV